MENSNPVAAFYANIKPFTKTGQATHGGKYSYREAHELAAIVHKAALAAGGWTRCESSEFRIDELKQGKQGLVQVVSVHVKVFFCHDGGEVLIGSAYGSGVNSDPGKSVSVAETQALKYAWNCGLVADASYEDAEADRNTKAAEAAKEAAKETAEDREWRERWEAVMNHPDVAAKMVPKAKGSDETVSLRDWLQGKWDSDKASWNILEAAEKTLGIERK